MRHDIFRTRKHWLPWLIHRHPIIKHKFQRVCLLKKNSLQSCNNCMRHVPSFEKEPENSGGLGKIIDTKNSRFRSTVASVSWIRRMIRWRISDRRFGLRWTSSTPLRGFHSRRVCKRDEIKAAIFVFSTRMNSPTS